MLNFSGMVQAIKYKVMKKIIFLFSLLIIFTSCEDFLDVPPTSGLTEDKLTDLPSMQALVYGAYSGVRSWGLVTYSNSMPACLVRDVVPRRSANWGPFYAHEFGGTFTSNKFRSGYDALQKLNLVAASDVENMIGEASLKNSILGDKHFRRALIYYDMNLNFTLNSTGNSVPLVLEPLGVDDRVSVAASSEIKAQVELDIEAARSRFANASGVADYWSATALAARIYFYHEKYDLAYQRANEVVTSGPYSLEATVTGPFINPSASSEVIFSFAFYEGEQTPSNVNFENFQADDDKGVFSLNEYSLVAQLRDADPTDLRHTNLYVDDGNLIYASGKFPAEKMDYIWLRYAEILLTRAEANIMQNSSVSAQDIDDVNMIKNRAGAADVVTGTPDMATMLNIIFEERSKELCFEVGDRFMNTRRLQKGIVNLTGDGEIAYSAYVDLMAFPFPDNEVTIHGLQR